MPAQVFFDERGDEVIAVVVTRTDAQIQWVVGSIAGRAHAFGLQLGFEELVAAARAAARLASW